MVDNVNSNPTAITFANEIIALANERLQGGDAVDDIAEGIRQAAGNFSAYAFARTGIPEDPGAITEQFVQLLRYYLDLHMQQTQQGQPSTSQSLEALVEQAKKELE